MRNRRTIGLLAAAAGAYLVYRLGPRRRAQVAEEHRPLPGDDLVPEPVCETTHTITIQATAAEIWPWLVQAGYHRGGWYTEARWYAWIERQLWHTTSPSVDRILPEYQHVAVGDIIPDGPPGTAYFTMRAVEPEQVLALYSTSHVRQALPGFLRNNPRFAEGCFSWVFVLQEIGLRRTRMTIRTRMVYGPRPFALLTRPFVALADGIMARMMLEGFKQRAESQSGAAGEETRLPDAPALSAVTG